MNNNSSIVACVFVAVATFLPSRCLATIGEYTHRLKDLWEEFIKYAVEMGSGAMTHLSSFITIGSAIQKLIEVIHRHTDSMVIP
jgi:hypothetical protein